MPTAESPIFGRRFVGEMYIWIRMLGTRHMADSKSGCTSVWIGELAATIQDHEGRIIQMPLKFGH
jgi:hypothetical protein